MKHTPRCNQIYRPNFSHNNSELIRVRICALPEDHMGYCKDMEDFKFCLEKALGGETIYWPDHMGNGPNGYPMNDKDFDEAAQKVLEARKDDIEQTENFLKAIDKSLRKQ